MTKPTAAIFHTPAQDDPQRWQAVLTRDASHDGAFVVAVKTTGIYCRPSCPAVKPKASNALFFLAPAAAEAAGYRACKRCRPQAAPPADPQITMVEQVCAIIRGHDSTPTLDELAAVVHVSPYHLQRVFKRLMGITPRAYASAQRIERLKAGLRAGEAVTTALYDAGFGSSSRLYAHAREGLGMTPSTYRQGAADMHIHYTIAESSLGLVLVAVTERGVCAVYLGDEAAQLETALQDEFPAAQIERADGAQADWVAQTVAYVSDARPCPDLPLDLRATAFQQQVWQALRAIPPGETRTYTEIAHAIGRADAVRAVAGACASNRVAVLIPCHRVVRSDGGLGGYRWGLARKEALLERERR